MKILNSSTLISVDQFDEIAPAVCHILENTENEDILYETILVIKSVIMHDDQNIQTLITSGIVPRLIKHLKPANLILEKSIVTLMCTLTPKLDEQMRLYALSNFSLFLKHQDQDIRRSAVYCLANIASCRDQWKSIMEANLLAHIFEVLIDDDLETKETAEWLSYVLIFNAEPIEIIHHFNFTAMETLFKLFECQDEHVIDVSLVA